MPWLIELLKPIWTWLLSTLMADAVSAIKLWLQEKAIEKKRASTAKQALDNYLAAGKSPELTPEQKAKEQEDAFEKLTTTVRNLP